MGIPMGSKGPHVFLLSVRGRKTGRLRKTPVGLFETKEHRYLFGTFGEAQWSKNLRVTGEAQLISGRRKETVVARELSADERASVLKEVLPPYLASRITRTFIRMGYDVSSDSPLSDFVTEAEQHPGFELSSKTRM
jgi:deazaflavin-dependent oxidoreductase (nitroreductase family)